MISPTSDLPDSGKKSANRRDKCLSSKILVISSRSNTVHCTPGGAYGCRFSASSEATVRPPAPHMREMVTDGREEGRTLPSWLVRCSMREIQRSILMLCHIPE